MHVAPYIEQQPVRRRPSSNSSPRSKCSDQPVARRDHVCDAPGDPAKYSYER